MVECPRCQGLMVIDTCLNMENVVHTVWVYEWRCLNCGEIIDAQTLANRSAQQPCGTSKHAQHAQVGA